MVRHGSGMVGMQPPSSFPPARRKDEIREGGGEKRYALGNERFNIAIAIIVTEV